MFLDVSTGISSKLATSVIKQTLTSEPFINERMSSREFLKRKKKKRENYISVLENNYCVSLSENFWHLFALFWTSAENNWFPYSTYLGCGNERVQRGGLLLYPEQVSSHSWCHWNLLEHSTGTQYWDTVAAGLGLMLKVICRARRKGDKGAGFAAFFTCTNTHTHAHTQTDISYQSYTALPLTIGDSQWGLRRLFGVCSVLEKYQTIHSVYQEIYPSC